jgi:hypothetical protein
MPIDCTHEPRGPKGSFETENNTSATFHGPRQRKKQTSSRTSTKANTIGVRVATTSTTVSCRERREVNELSQLLVPCYDTTRK